MPNTTTERISREVIRKACVKKSIIFTFFKFHNNFKVSIQFYCMKRAMPLGDKMSHYKPANHAFLHAQ